VRGASRASLAELTARLPQLAGGPRPGAPAEQVADELFGVVHLLDREHGLRRALSDPGKPAAEKAAVAEALLTGKVAPPVVELTAEAVRHRWSKPRDLCDALEQAAVQALVLAADAAGQLDDLEDELFRFGRVVAAQPALRAALADPALPGDRKSGLLAALLEGKVTGPTLRLVTQAALYPRGRSLEASLDVYARLAAQQRERLVAVVRTATELGPSQRDRLAAALAAAYGRQVHLNVVLDPEVIGGLSVQIADDVIDGTVAGRLEAVRRRLGA
jgi:F-type H+-transporting ATPase subunit delta